jgi:TorA maturation chaperone TorD
MHSRQPTLQSNLPIKASGMPIKTDAASTVLLPAEEQARAGLYRLLAHLLLAPPPASLFQSLAQADTFSSEKGGDALETAWEQLVLVASIMDAEAVHDEFNTLFVATGTPLLNPYESLYVSGFMMDRSLAALRDDLRELGLARQAGAAELEDHLGSLCETMSILIGQGRPLRLQRHFFDRHIVNWAIPCLDDMRNAEGANFYRHVANVIDAFLQIEKEAFDMEPINE